MELSESQLKGYATLLGPALQEAIEKSGLHGFQIDTVTLKSKSDVTALGLIPSCHMECTVGGFPPKVDCHLVCD